MSSLILKQLPLLEILAKVKKNSRTKILKHCDSKLTEAIIECIFNVLRNNVRLEQKRVKKLRKYKNILRKIANPKNKVKSKQKLIIQSGGAYLPIILTPIVSYLFDHIDNSQ